MSWSCGELRFGQVRVRLDRSSIPARDHEQEGVFRVRLPIMVCTMYGRVSREVKVGVSAAKRFERGCDSAKREKVQRHQPRMVDAAQGVRSRSMAGRKVAMLAAFGPKSDDVRGSPFLDISRQLHCQGAQVRVTEPRTIDNAIKNSPELTFVDASVEVVEDTDVTVMPTEWQEYFPMDTELIDYLLSRRCIVDNRNSLNPANWRAVNWIYSAMDRC